MSSQNIFEKKDKLGKPFKSQRYSISFFKPYQASALFVLGKYECLRTKLQSFVYHCKQIDPQKSIKRQYLKNENGVIDQKNFR